MNSGGEGMETDKKNKRDFSIDLVKAIAVLIIINSHADVCYAKFGALATGGAIGDGLFLFCSGYTLFLGRARTFMNYYKRRIQRIYPSVFAALIIVICMGCLPFEKISLKRILGGEFVIAIMLYYVLLYFVRKFLIKKMSLCVLITLVATIVAYYFFPYKMETGIKGLYGIATLFRWIPYFGFMLLGAFVGINRDKLSFSFKFDICKLLFCIILFHAILFLAKVWPPFAIAQIVSLPVLFGVVFYFYKVCNASLLQSLKEMKISRNIVMFLGGVCLESYLIQNYFMTDKLNFIFPLNLPIIFAGILLLSYIVRCLSRFIAQTFKSEDYSYRDIFSL